MNKIKWLFSWDYADDKNRYEFIKDKLVCIGTPTPKVKTKPDYLISVIESDLITKHTNKWRKEI